MPVEYKLTKSEYIRIGQDSFGGSQNWFANEHKLQWMPSVLRDYGCGVIAMTDLFMYLSRTRKGMDTKDIRRYVGTDMPYEQKKYLQLVRKINRWYGHVIPKSGMNGLVLAFGVQQYFLRHRYRAVAVWSVHLFSRTMLRAIKKQLAADYPVILAIGPNFPNIFGKKGIPFYYVKQDGHPGNKAYEQVNRHFVTVTGIYEEKGTVWLQISSWGKRYFINWKEYRQYRRRVGGIVTSAFLRIFDIKS